MVSCSSFSSSLSSLSLPWCFHIPTLFFLLLFPSFESGLGYKVLLKGAIHHGFDGIPPFFTISDAYLPSVELFEWQKEKKSSHASTSHRQRKSAMIFIQAPSSISLSLHLPRTKEVFLVARAKGTRKEKLPPLLKPIRGTAFLYLLSPFPTTISPERST